MKKKDKEALFAKKQDELEKLAQDLRPEIAKIKMEIKLGKSKNLNEARNKMKDRARMLTIAGNKRRETKNV